MQKIVAIAMGLFAGTALAAEPPFKAGPNQQWQPEPVRIVCLAGEQIVLEAPLAWVLLEANAEGKMAFEMFVDPQGHKIAIGLVMLATNCAVQRLDTSN